MKYAGSVVEPKGTQLDYYVCEKDEQHRAADRWQKRWWFPFRDRREQLFDDVARNAFESARSGQEVKDRIRERGWTGHK